MSQMMLEASEASEKIKNLLSRDQELYAKLAFELQKQNPNLVATIARGSSDHAATYAQYLFPAVTGRVVASIPPSVVTVLRSPIQLKNQLVMGISQSGVSPDIVNTFSAAKQSGAMAVGIANDSESPLAKTAEYFFNQHADLEKGLAATKTVLCTQTVLARIAALWVRDQKLLEGLGELPELLRSNFAMGERLAAQGLQQGKNVFVISRALGMGAAFEVALKIKETCGLHSEAFSTAEVKHGPKEIVDENFCVLALLLPGCGEEEILTTAKELKAQGAQVMVVGTDSNRADLVFKWGSDERLASICLLQMLYPWLANSAKALGRDPDKPLRLKSKVVSTF
jgi:glucosamine--fructose-6-phosphate aminotransferase (isomerizing)